MSDVKASPTPPEQSSFVHSMSLLTRLSQTLTNQHRTDFSLLLNLYSAALSPAVTKSAKEEAEKKLRFVLGVPNAQKLVADDESYQLARLQVRAFHQASLRSVTLFNLLCPVALLAAETKTQGLGQTLYHNLSQSERNEASGQTPHFYTFDAEILYQALQITRHHAKNTSLYNPLIGK